MDSVVPYLVAIIPTIVVAAFFYVIIKRMIEGDRRERLAQSKFEAEQDRSRASADPDAVTHDEPRTGPEGGTPGDPGNPS
ncbi:hypothetical protein [Phycicoccus avicenniae]|uniref:hypothetical protein n=1 Tax=Phycicoccus avicenniae TaxID=2828860 RepID=UPI003D2B9CF4